MFLSDQVSRRSVLAIGTLAAPVILTRRGVAADQCVVGCWGEDYARLLRRTVDQPLLTAAGIEVVQSVADEGPRAAQLFAQHQARHSALDIACLGALNGVRAATAGLAETLDDTKLPNLKTIVPVLNSGSVIPDQFVPQMYTVLVFVSNLAKGEAPAESWADLLQPRRKGKTGVISALGAWMTMAAAVAAAGDATAFEPAKDYLLRLKANGLRHYLETDDVRSALQSGEIDVGITWLARAAMWRSNGYPMQGRVPEDGSIAYTSGMVMPSNAAHKESAYQYLNAMLDPSAQKAFAEQMGYLPSVENVTLSGKIAEVLSLPKDAKVIQPDYAKFAAVQAELSNWWVKNVDQ